MLWDISGPNIQCQSCASRYACKRFRVESYDPIIFLVSAFILTALDIRAIPLEISPNVRAARYMYPSAVYSRRVNIRIRVHVITAPATNQ